MWFLLELDISEIRQRLDQMTTLLSSVHPEESSSVGHAAPIASSTIDTATAHVSLADRDGVDIEFPFMIIQRRSTMHLLDLDPGLATWLVNIERAIPAYPALTDSTLGSSASRLLMMQSHRVTTDLARFSEHVHIWYPLFPLDFTETFFHSIGNVGNSPVKSCLAILSLAIGCVAGSDDAAAALGERQEFVYIHEAISRLPHVFLEHSIHALQCLILFAIYHLHLLQPCQAHDYILAASFRVQNMLRSQQYPPESDLGDLLGRAYWTILLIESELLIQLDLPHSGIWAFSDSVSLRSTSKIWHFPPHGSETRTTTLRASSSPSPIPSPTPPDHTLAYFLSEIAMRRMLQRCTTSMTKSASGRVRYALVIATELELQLHEWYDYLPPPLRFPKNLDVVDPELLHPNAQFLQAQFFACKASIYWPAVYQAIEDGQMDEKLSECCAKFVNAYLIFIPAAASSFKTCRVNGWTLAASVFIITMATLRAVSDPCFDKAFNNDRLQSCFSHAVQVFAGIGDRSTSLAALGRILGERVVSVQRKRDEDLISTTEESGYVDKDTR
ncbi:hypothetical protein FSARC_8838 [Fusarium sarcochroum]|uniref:Transcription factor domain-containing protein n=1 Tax=Fusarium sarcochroum TaxID=1208366 RepID=A0A8H4X6J6_9HYPO|nr:hypothetical protein FSARC_8838 [Fusarium sarcochroum]